MLDERGRGGCGGATRDAAVRGRPEGADCGGGSGGEGAGRPATDTGRERGGPEGDAVTELLVRGGGDCGGENAPWPRMTEP